MFNRLCLVATAATILGATVSQAQAQQPATPAKAPDSLSVYFDPASATVTPQGMAVLDQAARTYRDGKPIIMVVAGGSDSTGSASANLRLSQLRADHVLQGLVARGIPVERFQILAKGETEPAVSAPDGTPEARNRRVDISWRRHLSGRVPAALLLFAVSAQAATPEDARRAYDAGHFTDAMGIWAGLSRQGNAEAAYGLGMLYDLGNGMAEDPATAFLWYKTAAEAGVPAAEFNVAVMYDAGRGIAQDRARAALWYAKAAARGNCRAQYNLGLLYEQGDGVPRNTDAAAAWFRDALAGGIPAAAMRLKTLATPGPGKNLTLGPRTNPAQAVSLVFPDRDAKLTLKTDDQSVELIWIAPAEPSPAQYEVQVRNLDDPAMPIVFAATVAETAALAHMPMRPAFYIWNVVTVGPDGSRISADWIWFSVNPSSQSLASAPH